MATCTDEFTMLGKVLKRKAVTHLFGESGSGSPKDNYSNDVLHRKRLPMLCIIIEFTNLAGFISIIST